MDPGRQPGQALQFKDFRAVYNLLIWLSVIVATGAVKPAEADPTRQTAVRKGLVQRQNTSPYATGWPAYQ